jgi:hypothetical protein
MQELITYKTYITVLCLLVPALGIMFISVFRRVSWVIKLRNKISKNFGKVEWIIPPDLDYGEHQIIENAYKLAFFEVPQALKKAPISFIKKSQISKQSNQIPDNIVSLMEKLGQVRRVKNTINRYERHGNSSQRWDEVQKIEQDILAEIHYSMEILSSIPISLVRLELTRGDFSSIEKLLSGLNNANTRMKNLASSRQIHIGGNVTNSTIIIGDKNNIQK